MKNMKKIQYGLFAALFASAFLIAASTALAGKSETTFSSKKTPNPDEQIAQAVARNGHAFVYFYSPEYKTSADEAGRIADLARSEKAGFVKVNIAAPEAAVVARTFSLMYVPTVVHIKKGLGVVEQFSGPRNLKQLTEKRKAPARPPHSDQIEKISKNGGVTILEFYADWCNPCVEQMPKLEEAVRSADGRLSIIRLHVQKESALMSLYNVDAPPANVVLDSNGVPRLRTNSIASPESLLSTLSKLGIL